MNTNLFNQEWKVIWEIELNSSIFWLELNEWLVHRALVYQLANNRTNISHTKTRWERRWSTRKIYRQKWTGRARMGSNRSPVRKKGWVAFGPRNTVNFEITMNKKERISFSWQNRIWYNQNKKYGCSFKCSSIWKKCIVSYSC